MAPRMVAEGVYWVGALDWDRRLFDELIPLPDGTSYNAYLIQGAKRVALIDTVDPSKVERLLDSLRDLNIEWIDYVVANHAEQDHSGGIPEILEAYPEASVVATPRCKELLMDLLHLPEEKIKTVEDGEQLSLGDKTLEFIHAPWVHWPETMLTYLREQRILFTCDLFGSHLATSDLSVGDEGEVYEAAKRYYAEIMMPFRAVIRRHLERIKELEVDIIAPSHGPIYGDPSFILDAYERWISDEVENEVVIIYVSMHGSTGEMVARLVDALMERGVGVKPFNLTVTDIGELAIALVDAATLVVASPTVLGGPHPSILYAAHIINALRPKLRYIALITSYAWGGRTLKMLRETLSGLQAEIIDSIEIKGRARERDLKRMDRLADEILNKHQEGVFKEE